MHTILDQNKNNGTQSSNDQKNNVFPYRRFSNYESPSFDAEHFINGWEVADYDESVSAITFWTNNGPAAKTGEKKDCKRKNK